MRSATTRPRPGQPQWYWKLGTARAREHPVPLHGVSGRAGAKHKGGNPGLSRQRRSSPGRRPPATRGRSETTTPFVTGPKVSRIPSGHVRHRQSWAGVDPRGRHTLKPFACERMSLCAWTATRELGRVSTALVASPHVDQLWTLRGDKGAFPLRARSRLESRPGFCCEPRREAP